MGVSQIFKLCTPGNENESVAWIDSPQDYNKEPRLIGVEQVTAGGKTYIEYVAEKQEWTLTYKYADDAFRDKINQLRSWAISQGSHLRFMDEDGTWYNVLPVSLAAMPQHAPAGLNPILWDFTIKLRER